MKEVKITSDKILEAASKCSTAKATLKILFPEVFEDEKYFDLSKLRTAVNDGSHRKIFDNESLYSIEAGPFMEVRAHGNFGDKGFWLSKKLGWELVKDDMDELVLLPTKI